MDEPSTLTRNEKEMCKLCNALPRRYTCPRCEIPYCSLECYKTEIHSDCSESFYKEWVESELKNRENDSVSRRKMIDILKRMHETEAECHLTEEDEQETPIDSDDDDDDVPDLERRLENIDLDNADELWEALTDAERQEFEANLRNGEADKLVPLWIPWWSNPATKKLIREVRSENEKPVCAKGCPEIVDVPKFNELAKASPNVGFNLTNVLHAYAYTALHCNGDHENSANEFVSIFLRLSENMRNNKVFEDSESAIESVSRSATDYQSLPGDEEAMAAAKEAVNLIIQGPEEDSNSTFYVSAALSDLHKLFTKAKNECSSRQNKSSDQTFSNKFRVGETGLELSKKSLLLCIKKIEYYLSWVKSRGPRVDEL